MMTVNDLIEHLKNTYDGDTQIAYRLWVQGDMFYALQENECYNAVPADADFDTFAETHPMEYIVFNKVTAPILLDYVERNMDCDYSDIAEEYSQYLENDTDFIRWVEEARNEYTAKQEYGESAEADVFVALTRGN
jgi:hypothetical protein